MKQILISVFLSAFMFLRTHSAFAGNLCDAECSLSITFPDGGSIEAAEPLSFTFGDGGYVNDGAVTTGYSSGETLSLAAGESLVFQSGATLDLGASGNLDYTSILTNTNGVIEVSVSGGSEKVIIHEMQFIGNVNFIIHGDVELADTGSIAVQVGSEVTLTFDGDGTTISNGSGVVLTNDSAQTLDIIYSGTVYEPPTYDPSTSSGSITNSGSISACSSSCGSDSSSANGSAYGIYIGAGLTGSLTNTNSGTISGGVVPTGPATATSIYVGDDLTGGILILIFKEITIDGVLYKSEDGVIFKDADGNTGTVEFKDGAYVFTVDETAVVTVDETASIGNGDSSGIAATGLWLVLGLPWLMFLLRRFQAKVFPIR